MSKLLDLRNFERIASDVPLPQKVIVEPRSTSPRDKAETCADKIRGQSLVH